MSTIYSGNQANITTPLVRTITSAVSQSGLIKIGTSASHLFATNDYVYIAGVGGTTEANGAWTITVIDATHFTLNGSSFTHAYTSGGTATDRSLTPAFAMPSDGETSTAASIEASIQMLADRTQYLATLPAQPTRIAIAPHPFDISYGSNWLIGTNLAHNGPGSIVAKAVVDDNAIIADITPYLLAHNGQFLDTLVTVFSVGQAHTGVPGILPSSFLYRTQSLASFGGAPAADTSLFSGSLQSFPTPASGTAYYASGNIQSWILIADQNNTIDTTAYRYYAGFIDESGTNSLSGNNYYGMTVVIG